MEKKQPLNIKQPPPLTEQKFAPIDPGELSSRDKDYLIHELQTHQIELEIQNEQLRAAQQELEESRCKYADLYNFAPVGYFTLDANDVIKHVNETAARLLSIDKQILLDKPLSLFIDQDDQVKFSMYRTAARKDAGCNSCEIKFTNKDGRVFYAELQTGSRDENSSGEWRVVMSDITRRMSAEWLLRESEERYRSLVESSPEAICVLQSNHFVFINAAGLALFGAGSQAELLGEEVANCIHPDFLESFHKTTREIEETGAACASLELRILRKDGQSVEGEAAATRINFVGRTAVQLIIKDVTARKMSEKTLRFQAKVLAHVNDAVVVTDKDKRITFWNKGAEQLYRYSGAEVLGRRREEIRLFCWNNQEDEKAAYDALEKTGLWRGEGSYQARTGEHIISKALCPS